MTKPEGVITLRLFVSLFSCFTDPGEVQGEGGALAGSALDGDGSIEQFDQELYEGESDAVAAGLAGTGFVYAVEAVEDARQVGS